MVNWYAIDTVLLDMDGTLLDLNFDNHFWQQHVPLRYAQKHGISLDAAREDIFPRYRQAEGTMNWYCLDYWTGELGLDIMQLKQELEHLIAVHPHVFAFLDAVRAAGKRLALVTNAHSKSLELKMNKTDLGKHFDRIICAHDYGLPKEDLRFWDHLVKDFPFDKQHTLLVDDSLSVLRSARNYGLAYLLAVYQPDTRQPVRVIEEFDAIHSFDELIPA